jgi:triosephosphate isomerase (TIM)
MGASKKIEIIGNWKMYPQTIDQARGHIRSLHAYLGTQKHLSITLCPPAVFIADLSRVAQLKKKILIGVQHIHGEAEGAFTGEVSAQQAYSSGARVAIVGHAERRKVGETNADTAKQVFMSATSGLVPVLCVGESARDAQGVFLKTVAAQITEGLSLLPQQMRGGVVIAYEPVYAIGAPKPPAEDEIHHMILAIKKVLVQTYGASVARSNRILYGGAVDATNATGLLTAIPDLSGFLVGRASVDPEKFQALLISLS